LLTVRLDRLPHDRNFGIDECIQRGFLFLGQGRFGLQQDVTETDKAIHRGRSRGNSPSCRCGTSRSGSGRWRRQCITERAEIDILGEGRTRRQNEGR
jgi:hypothetical protein